jgi:hypothetical protein
MIANAAIMSAKLVKARKKTAARLWRASTISSSTEEISAAGINRLIGLARLAIIVWPMSRKTSGAIDEMDRLRLNHVPQNTPITSARGY